MYWKRIFKSSSFFPFEANSVIPDHSGNYNIYKKSRRFRAIVKYIFNSIPY